MRSEAQRMTPQRATVDAWQRADPQPPAALVDWPLGWRGRWIWDHEPDVSYWWDLKPGSSHFTYLRRVFDVAVVPEQLFGRATADSRYALYLNGSLVGRGPAREEPEHLSWDEYDLAPLLRTGANVIVALCHYYGVEGPWWYPAAPMGTLGRGSFCFETAPGAAVDLVSDATWRAIAAPWIPQQGRSMHSYPPEIVDGRRAPESLHDPAASLDDRPHAFVLSGRGQSTVLDRPPAAPYMDPLRRAIPQLTSRVLPPARITEAGRRVRVEIVGDPALTWATVKDDPGGDRVVRAWDLGMLTLGYVRARVTAPAGAPGGAVIDIVGGEDASDDGLPEIRPRRWAARYIHGGSPVEEVTFFDPVGLRCIGAHHPLGFEVSVDVEEAIYPRPGGASFTCDDPRYEQLWQTGVRSVERSASDAFIDCPGREQRAWVSDAYTQTLVSLVSSPDWRLVRRNLELTARSRFPGGLIAGAAACDFSHVAFTLPDYSLHWIRTLAAYWRHSGDEALVRRHLGVANAIIERYERQRGRSGLLEDFPGWVFIDWTQIDRDSVIGAHDALYATALEDYAALPGADDVSALIARTRSAFEALWDEERGIYVDSIGMRGKSRRISQQTNAAALLAGIVPAARVLRVIGAITDPPAAGLGRIVVTLTPVAARRKAGASGADASISFQYEKPEGFDEERDVVAAQIYFARFLHEALFRHGRRDIILRHLLRWDPQPEHGTFGEFWTVTPANGSRCHGWSASPTYDLTAYVLGVRPAEPGYGRAVVDPYLGPLTRASGRVPTPLGWLEVTVEQERVLLKVPDGMSVDVGRRSVGAGSHEVPVTISSRRG